MTIFEEVVSLLLEKEKTITFAESCTAGLAAARLGEVSGASGCFAGSLVSYANAVKSKFLGVSEEVLAGFGAVSEECVRQMAAGAAGLFGADVAVAISGVAGPTGGSEQKPVGTVFVGVFYEGEVSVVRLNLCGERNEIREKAVEIAYEMVLGVLKNDNLR